MIVVLRLGEKGKLRRRIRNCGWEEGVGDGDTGRKMSDGFFKTVVLLVGSSRGIMKRGTRC